MNCSTITRRVAPTSSLSGWTALMTGKPRRVRLIRLQNGNFGDCKPVGEGVWEQRIDWGPGYRVYYAIANKHLVLLCDGGDKRTQEADIARAITRWNEWQIRGKK